MKKNQIETLRNSIVSNLSDMLELKHTIKKKDLEKHDLMKEFLLGVIEVIDSFENKENSLKEKHSGSAEILKVVISYDSIRKKLVNLLGKYGVTKIEFPENKLIVGFSKVVATEPDSTKGNDTIITIVRNGYVRGSDVIREAELIIVKN